MVNGEAQRAHWFTLEGSDIRLGVVGKLQMVIGRKKIWNV